MGQQGNTQHLIDKVSTYLNNELSQEARQALLKEIEANPTSSDMLNQEIVFKNFLKSKIQVRKASPSLINSIKEKIKYTSPPA